MEMCLNCQAVVKVGYNTVIAALQFEETKTSLNREFDVSCAIFRDGYQQARDHLEIRANCCGIRERPLVERRRLRLGSAEYKADRNDDTAVTCIMIRRSRHIAN